jgi:hypothetical protein
MGTPRWRSTSDAISAARLLSKTTTALPSKPIWDIPCSCHQSGVGRPEFATLSSVTDSIGDHGNGAEPLHDPKDGRAEGPDPAIGAGITLLGIFLMGTGGARDAHYVFDVGVVTGVVGAGLFVLFVALSVMRGKRPNAEV